MTEVDTVSDGFIDRVADEMVEAAKCGAIKLIDPETLTTHKFVKQGGEGTIGLYARELRIPAESHVVGELHKTDHLFILSQGTITIWDDNGEMLTISAPFTCVAPAGTRRYGYAHTDCVVTNVHGTNETNIEKLESDLIVKMEAPLLV